MSYYRTCPRCGAHLDPGESCDCLRQELTDEIVSMTEAEHGLALKAVLIYRQHPEWTPEECVEKAARGATNTTDGKAEKVLESSDSASTITENGGFVK